MRGKGRREWSTGPSHPGEQNNCFPFGWGAAPQDASGPAHSSAQRLTLPSTGTPTAFNSQFLITVLAQLLVLLLSFIIKGPVSVF